MRTITKTVYLFSELSEVAKERAREWYRNASASDSMDSECVIADAVEVGAIMGIEISHRTWTNSHGFKGKTPTVYFSGFCSQGDGASFEGDYRYSKNAVNRIADHTGGDVLLVSIADRLQSVQKRHFYGLRGTISQSGRYVHEYTMSADVWHVNGNPADEYTVDELLDCFRDFARWIYRQLEAEYDWQQSDAAVDENITCNDYEFTEEGERA